MAKYDVVCSCGHEETIVLYGKSSERERKIEWLENYGLCSECYKAQMQKHEETSRKTRKEAFDLPAIKGSPKQVAWAEKIRDGFFKDWENLGVQKDLRAEKFINWLKKQAEARFWIDNREKSIRELVKEWAENESKIDAVEESKELERAAKEESTIYPEREETRDVAEISYKGEFVEIKSPKNDIIIETARAAGYKWEGEKSRWCMKVTATRGRVEDRIAEIGNLLLNAGVPICIYDEEVREKAVRGEFEPQKHKWILKSGDEEVEIYWRTREYSLYDEAKRLPHAKYREGTMRVPSRYFAEIREFVKLYDLGISEAAEALLTQEEKAYKERITVSPKKTESDSQRGDKLKEIMESSRDVLEDLRDED